MPASMRPQQNAGVVTRRGRIASVSTVGTSEAQASVSNKARKDGIQLCGTCSNDVGDSAIGCDECEVWVHNTEMCSGLTQDMIDAIGRYHGQGIKFVCTKCRLDFNVAKGNSPSGKTQPHMVELVAQLFQQMKGICSAVQNLIENVKTPASDVAGHPGAESTANPTSKPHSSISYAEAVASDPPCRPPPETYRKLVREELRELEEQKKRRSSLVIRGLGAASPREACSKFEDVTEYLIGSKVPLTEVVRIPGEADLFRGKVTDDEVRKSILDKAKHLKDSSSYDKIFIRRDLTFNQRATLKAKRAAAGLNQGRIFTRSNHLSSDPSQAGPPPSSSQQVSEPVGIPQAPRPTGASEVETIPKTVDEASN